MAIFNPQYLTNPLASLNTAFGIPTCILSMGAGALGLLSSDVLGSVAAAANEGKAAARRAISSVVSDLFGEMGLLQYDAGSGQLALFSASSKFGLDLSFLNTLANITAGLAELEEFANQGIELYEEVKKCLGEFESWKKGTGPPPLTGMGGVGGGSVDEYTQEYRAAALGIAKQQVESATEFINQCDELLVNIGTVLLEREDAVDAPDSDEPIFRLVYGPPVSKKGVFILSEDGLYFDSQERLYNGKHTPSPSDIGFVVDSDKWELDHAPNLGGKGTIVSLDDLNTYVNTIFDLNHIDNTDNLNIFYKEDHLLGVLEGQKEKLVYDLSSHVGELVAGGYSIDSAIVTNLKHSLNSTISTFNEKINKRKKQIEVAVKGPDLFGGEHFEPGTIPVNDFSYLSSIGFEVALENQEALVFGAGDVEGVVLPIHPVYASNYGSESNVLLEPLVVPPIGKGSIIFNPSVSSEAAPALSLTDEIETGGMFAVYNFLKPDGVAPASPEFNSWNCATIGSHGNGQLIGHVPKLFVSGLGVPALGGLVRVNSAHYQISRTAGALRLPPTQEFQNLFYNASGCSMDCWLHIPDYATSGENVKEAHSEGPPNLYPSRGGWADYNYYKILLANENTGGDLGVPSVSALVDSNGSNTTKGLLIGFTRDPTIYSDTLLIPGPNTQPGLNAYFDTSNTTASSCFFIAPTLSMNASNVEFVPTNTDCVTDGFRKITIKDDVSSAAYDDGMGLDTSSPLFFRNVSGEFMHINISFDFLKDECSVYLDGNLMTTSSVSYLFGHEVGHRPAIPTFITTDGYPNSSFFYSKYRVNQAYPVNIFDEGPRTDQYFTPWIVGSGWTDGLPITEPPTIEDHPGAGEGAADKMVLPGGFMGDRHGISSGLNGLVGSLKFYSRPLDIKEVRKNYEAQKSFFKNIKTQEDA